MCNKEVKKHIKNLGHYMLILIEKILYLMLIYSLSGLLTTVSQMELEK